jgi:hypothetical protein
MYCDMTPESQNSRLLNNGSLKHVSVTKNRHARIQGLLGGNDLYTVRPEIKSGTCNFIREFFQP